MKKVDFSVFVESELAGLGLAGCLIVEECFCIDLTISIHHITKGINQ